ncbi:hypothetical protein C8R46DRAFT_1024085 [Mycena filopes]|nr:hypothetical protein C8R46DRAFT_1024085 [Mycena filopes]
MQARENRLKNEPSAGWTLAKRIFMVIATLSVLSIFISGPSVGSQRSSSSHPILRRTTAPASSAPEPDCSNPPQDSCTFYANCLESRYNCGADGYPLGYGQKFCTKFLAEQTLLSAAGQTWMLATLHCLQEALVPDALGAAGATGSCSALEDKAFGTHAGCYVSNGVCALPLSDWEAILHIVGVETLVDSWDAFKATLEAGAECLEFYAFLIARGL